MSTPNQPSSDRQGPPAGPGSQPQAGKPEGANGAPSPAPSTPTPPAKPDAPESAKSAPGQTAAPAQQAPAKAPGQDRPAAPAQGAGQTPPRPQGQAPQGQQPTGPSRPAQAPPSSATPAAPAQGSRPAGAPPQGGAAPAAPQGGRPTQAPTGQAPTQAPGQRPQQNGGPANGAGTRPVSPTSGPATRPGAPAGAPGTRPTSPTSGPGTRPAAQAGGPATRPGAAAGAPGTRPASAPGGQGTRPGGAAAGKPAAAAPSGDDAAKAARKEAAKAKTAVIDGPTRHIDRSDLAKDLPDLSAVKHPLPGDAPAAAGAGAKTGAQPAVVAVPIDAVAGDPLRATIQVRKVDPWSTLKVSLVISVALFFVWMFAVGFLYVVLDGMGVWDRLNNAFTDIVSESGDEGLVSAGQVFGYAALVGAINVVLFTALATIGSFIYNLCTDLVGGVEVTLADRD